MRTLRSDAELNWSNIYFRDIQDTPILSAADEKALCDKAFDGDKDAINRLVTLNLPLVVKVASKYVNSFLSLEDLIQEGSIGLMRAAVKFKPNKNCRFSTYACLWIKQGISRAIENNSRSIRLPSNVFSNNIFILKKKRELTGILGRDPSTEELASFTGKSKKFVSSHDFIPTVPTSLNKEVKVTGEGGVGSRLELWQIIQDPNSISPEDGVLKENKKATLDAFLGTLNDKERRLIELKFGLLDGTPKTSRYVANYFGMSVHTLRKIERSILRKLSKTASLHGVFGDLQND